METMFLVAGLAVAGLVGIAAAFYFSIRSGNRGDKRLRSAGAGRAGAARRPEGKNSTARPDLTRPDLNGHPRRTSNGTGPVTTFRPAAVSPRTTRAKADTGPDPVADFDQVLAGGRRAAPGVTATRGGSRWPGDADADAEGSWSEDSWPDDPMPGDPTATDPRLGGAGRGAGETRPAARLSRDAHAAGDTAGATKPRRRVGFRKGADLDEELWPAESFGGVSDEQFWDDLASDKPLATTARAAQQDPPGRNRLSGPAAGAGLPTGSGAGPAAGLDTGPATDPQAVQAQAADRKRDDRASGGGRRGSGTGAYPAPRALSDAAAERTAIQPAYAATQPVQSMKPPVPGATRPVRAAASSYQPREAATPPRGTATPPGVSATQPAETRRRRPSVEEDPLTSAAFSLRPSGPVDGRSSRRARNADSYDTGGSTGSRGGTSPYPYPALSYDDSSSATQAMSTPSYGQSYGRGNSAGEPRRQNGTGSHARPEGTGEGTRPARPVYPQDSHQATGSYQSTGGYQGTGSSQANAGNNGSGGYQGNGSYPTNGYPSNGHRGNGHRAPYDPRDDYRRLTHQY
jgi:hypothetical protein